jgi:7-carboxy-7-deazaguanine synthase
MTYSVKEIFYTLQGEGAQAGRPAVFCRFAGCNLWSGREEDRATAVCKFCDTDFVGTDGTRGGKYANAQALVTRRKINRFAERNKVTRSITAPIAQQLR